MNKSNINFIEMKLTLLFAFLVVTAATVNAASLHEEDWETRTWEFGNFTEVYLEGGYKVYLIQGDKNSIRVKASDEDVLDDLKIRNDRDQLKIKVEREHFDFSRVILYITFRELDKLNIEGGVKLETKGYLNLNDLDMHISGGAKLEMNMKAKNVDIFSEGGVFMELDGVADQLDIKISGAGHIDADELKAKDVSVRIEGVGTGSVYAEETLYTKIEGVGRVRYRGNPKVTKDIEGLGSVKKD